MSAFPTEATAAVTRAVAAVGLRHTGLAFPSTPLGAAPWRELVTSVQLHRITGLLAAAVHTDRLPATQDQIDEVSRLHAEMMAICLRLERDLVRLRHAFDDAEIEFRVLKGPSFAHLDYPEPALRFFGDIDVLVAPADFDRAVSTLSDVGYRRRFRQVRPGFDRRFGKGASFKGPEAREIDLHRTLVMGPYGLTIDLEELWRAAVQFQLAGMHFSALDADLRFLHACYHTALGKREPQLVPMRDLAEMAQRPEGSVDTAHVIEVASRWGGTAVVARAVTLAWATLALPESDLSQWAGTVEPTRADRRALRTYLDPGMGYAARSFVALRAVRGVGAKARYTSALLFPDRSYGAGRHAGRMARWIDGGRQVLRVGRR